MTTIIHTLARAVLPVRRRLGIAAFLLMLPMAFAAPLSLNKIKPVKPDDFFPGSKAPEAVRERLANRLLGRARVTDPAFDDYFRKVAKQLAPDDNFLMVSAANDDVNAFAYYGGLIVMMRGMWNFAKNEDAFLGIVAHEMGHIKLNHFESAQKLNDTITAIGIPLLIAGLLADSPELRESIIVGGSGIITGQIYGHSRELEQEADVVGLKMLTNSERDGREVSNLLGKLAGGDNEYLSTHPAPLRRAAYIKDRLLGQQEYEPKDSLDFLLLREKLAATKGAAEFIRNKQRELKSATDNEKIALRLGLMMAALISRNKKLGAEMEAALADQSHPFIVAARADYISRGGDHLRALDILTVSRESHPQSAALAVQHAIVLRRAEQHQELLALHETMPDELKNRGDILREVSQSASALGQLGLANLLLAQAHIKDGNFELGRQQLDIAAKYKMSTKMLVKANKFQNTIKHELSLLSK